MALSGPANYYLQQVRQLPTEDARLGLLEGLATAGTLGRQGVSELAQEAELSGPSLQRLARLEHAIAAAPLFVPTFAEHRSAGAGAQRAFGTQLRALLGEPAAKTTEDAIQRVMRERRGLVQSLDPAARHEWGLVVRLCRAHTPDPMALEAGLRAVLDELAAKPKSTSARLDTLQAVRRELLLNVLERPHFDAIYRYSRDHDVNTPLRQFHQVQHMPHEVLSSPRRTLAAEARAPAGRPGAGYTPISGLSTGQFIESLDGGLRALAELQGRDPSTLFRATLFRKGWVEDMVKTQTFQDAGYVSTSANTDKTAGFFRHPDSIRHEDEVPVLMVFETTRAVDISCLSRFTNETERLIPRGERFQASLLGYRRDLAPGVDIPDSENWAVFVMTDEDKSVSGAALRSIRKLAGAAVG